MYYTANLKSADSFKCKGVSRYKAFQKLFEWIQETFEGQSNQKEAS